jgi:hypothetical protein
MRRLKLFRTIVVCLCLVMLFSVRTTWASPFPANPKEGQGNDTLLCTIEIVACNQITPSTTVPNGTTQLRTIESQAHADYENGKYLPAIFLFKQLLKIYPKDTSLLTDLASRLT